MVSHSPSIPERIRKANQEKIRMPIYGTEHESIGNKSAPLSRATSIPILYLENGFLLILQGIFLDILAKLGVIKSHHFWLEVDQIEESLRNTLVCVEMVFFSAAMQYAYSVEPYRDDDASSTVKDKKRE